MSSHEYTVAIDDIDAPDWEASVQGFRDANIYQTWAWGAATSGDQLSHIVVREGPEVVAAVQARLVRLAAVGAGLAYVRWGPLWKPRARPPSAEALRLLVGAMQREFAERRGLLLRLSPCEPDSPDSSVAEVLKAAHFRKTNDSSTTLLLPLDPPLETIRRNMSGNWRKNLRHSENNGLSVASVTDSELFDTMEGLSQELSARKRSLAPFDIDLYRDLQARLPSWAKLTVMVCRAGSTPVAGLVGCALGDVGIELVAATGSQGLDLRGSYLLRWRMCQLLKESGCRFYDLNGINPSINPGGYQFKSGLCGKHGLEVQWLGDFEYCTSALSYAGVRLGDLARAVAGPTLKTCVRKMSHWRHR